MAVLFNQGVGTDDAQLGGGTGSLGRDFIDNINGCASDGTLETINILMDSPVAVKVKVWRVNGANFDFVGESTLPALSAGLNSNVALDTPISVLAGDFLGLHVAPNSGAISVQSASPDQVAWDSADSDYTTSQPTANFSTTFAFAFNILGEGTAAGTDSITVDDLEPAYIRDLTTGDISFSLSGSYVGTPTTIEYQIHYADDNSVYQAWQTYIASPAGGTFTGSAITLPTTTRGYYAAVRFSNDTGVTDTTTSTVVADKYLVYGESLARDMETDGALTPTADLVFYMDRDTGALSVPTTGYGNVALANAISAQTGYGTIIVTSGSGGMAMLEVNNPGNYLYDPVTPTANYTNVLTGYNQGSPARACILLVGANDAFFGNSTAAQFEQVFADHFAEFRSDVSRPTMPIFASLTGVHLDPAASSKWGSFVLAQKAAYKSDANVFFSAHYDATLQDNVHPSGNATGYGLIGNRMANAIITEVLGGSAAYICPEISSFTLDSQTQSTITLTLNDGTDISAATNISGLQLSDDNGTSYAVSLTSVDGASANTLTATHASATITDYRYMYGANPDRTNILLSNSLPVLPDEGVPVSSSLIITISGIPDGTYRTVLIDDANNIISSGNQTYTSGTVTVNGLAVSVGANIEGFVIDNQSPHVNGAVITGTTV